MMGSKFVLTDSGGIQTESSVLNIPCLTMRTNTERPETISQGTNILVGHDIQSITEESQRIIDGHGKHGKHLKLWDGFVADRIVENIRNNG